MFGHLWLSFNAANIKTLMFKNWCKIPIMLVEQCVPWHMVFRNDQDVRLLEHVH